MCESRTETVSDLKPARSGSCRPGWFLVDLAVIVLLGDLTERVGYYSFVGTRPIAMTVRMVTMTVQLFAMTVQIKDVTISLTTYFPMAAQAIRAPELPAGSVLLSSGSAWMTSALPSPSNSEFGSPFFNVTSAVVI